LDAKLKAAANDLAKKELSVLAAQKQFEAEKAAAEYGLKMRVDAEALKEAEFEQGIEARAAEAAAEVAAEVARAEKTRRAAEESYAAALARTQAAQEAWRACDWAGQNECARCHEKPVSTSRASGLLFSLASLISSFSPSFILAGDGCQRAMRPPPPVHGMQRCAPERAKGQHVPCVRCLERAV